MSFQVPSFLKHGKFSSELFKKYRVTLTISALLVLFTFSLLYALPSFCEETEVTLPDISAIRPFSAEANYMSLEGFVMSYCRVTCGRDISRGEARKLIKESRRAHKNIEAPLSASVSVEQAPAPEKTLHSDIVIERPKTSYSDKVAAKYKEFTEYRQNKSEMRLEAKKVVILPFRNIVDEHTPAVEYVSYYTEKFFRSKGYETIVLSEKDIDVESLGRTALNEIAAKYGADLVVTGDINYFKRFKRLSASGAPFVVTGVHNLARVSLSTRIYKASEQAITYENTISVGKKHQWFGLVHGDEGTVSHAVSSNIRKLFGGFVKQYEK